MKISFGRYIVTLFILIAIGILIAAIITNRNNHIYQNTNYWVVHTHAVLYKSEQVLALTKDIDVGSRGYIISGDSTFLAPFSQSQAIIKDEIKNLKELTKDNPRQQARIDSLSVWVEKRIAFAQQAINLRNQEGFRAAFDLVALRQGIYLSEKIKNTIVDIKQEENNLLLQRRKHNTESIHNFTIAFYILILSILILFLIFSLTIRHNIAARNRTNTWLNKEIEERKEAEKEIKKAHQKTQQILNRLQQLMDTALDTICLTNEEGRFLQVSSACENLWGYKPEEMIGRKYQDLVYEPDRPETEKAVAEIMKGVVGREFENRCRKKDGSLVPIIWTAVWSAEEKTMYTIARDSTEKKQTLAQLKARTEELTARKKRFRALVENNEDGITVSDSLGQITYHSPAFERMTGFTPEERIHKDLVYFIHPNDLASAKRHFLESLKNPGVPIPLLLRILHKSGQYIWIEGTTTNLLADPNVKGSITNYRDISERKKFEQEREQLILELTQHNKDLRQFSYITSHNFRGPLANLLGLLNLIKTIPIEDTYLAQIIAGFNTSTTSLNEAINDLVTILNIKDSPSVHQEEIYLAETFEKIRQLTSNGLELCQVNFDFEQVPVITFNKVYIESIFMNLLTNSFKYACSTRKLTITITTEDLGNEVLLKFRDNGIGLDIERYKDRIFGLYQRFHPNKEGKGLGLYLIKSQIEALGGYIEIESQVDVGTTFILHFKKASA